MGMRYDILLAGCKMDIMLLLKYQQLGIYDFV